MFDGYCLAQRFFTAPLFRDGFSRFRLTAIASRSASSLTKGTISMQSIKFDGYCLAQRFFTFQTSPTPPPQPSLTAIASRSASSLGGGDELRLVDAAFDGYCLAQRFFT